MTATIHAHPASMQGPQRLIPTVLALQEAFGTPVWIDPADPTNTVIPLTDSHIAVMRRELAK